MNNLPTTLGMNNDVTGSIMQLTILTSAREGTAVATNRKVAGSIPAGVIGFFIDIKSFRSHYGPGVNSASNRNE